MSRSDVSPHVTMGTRAEIIATIILMFLTTVLCQLDFETQCPQLLPRLFVGFAPRGNETAGVYKKSTEAEDIDHCVSLCCAQQSCNVVFMHKVTCYQVNTSILILSVLNMF